MERKIETKKWQLQTKLNMEFLVKDNLDKGATVTVVPVTHPIKHTTYNITVNLPESDEDYEERLKSEYTEMEEDIKDCDKKHKEYIKQIESIRKDIDTNNALSNNYRKRKQTVYSILCATTHKGM